MKNKFLIFIFGILFLLSFISYASAANSNGILQIWRNSSTGANVTWVDNNGNLYTLGNVGVGKTPSYKLDVAGDINGYRLLVNGSPVATTSSSNVTSSGSANYVPYFTSSSNLGNSNIYYNASTGNLGVGTVNPGGKLEVSNGAIRVTGTTTALSGGLGLELFKDSTYQYVGAYNRDTSTYGKLYLYGNPVILNGGSEGNVGIGTTGPALKLAVYGATGYPAASGTSQTGIVRLEATNNNVMDFGQANASPWGTWIQSTDRSNLALTYPLLLNPNGGNVGIGTTNPSQKLDVAGSIALSADIYQTGTPSQLDINPYQQVRFGRSTNNTNFAVSIFKGDNTNSINSYFAGNGNSYLNALGGNVGIGTTNPLHKLDVNGSFYSELVVKGNCTGAVTIDWNAGNTQHCVLTGNVTFTFSNGQSGGSYKLVLKQGGTGSYTVTWPASVRWGSGVAPTLTTTVGKTDYAGFFYNGVDSTYDGNAFNANF